jgi:DNA polymerase-3 subunit epsilon
MNSPQMSSARTEAIQMAKSKLALSPVYLDTETTGTGPTDEVIEIGIVDADGKTLFESLVKPVGKVGLAAFSVHGISEEMLVNAPRWMIVWPKVEAVLAGRTVGIYNADFDLRMFQQTHARYKLRWIIPQGASFFCVMKLYAQYYGERNLKTGGYRWQSLENAGRQCQLPEPNAHRSVADSLLTRALLHYIAGQ